MEDDTDTGGEFNLQEAANEIIAEGDSGSASVDDSSQAAGQSVTDSQQTAENKELGPEEILKLVGEQKEDPAQFADLLKAVNGLGAMGNGVPVAIDSPEKLKQLIEMGSGFYAKTEEHANLVKAKEAEYLQKDTEFKQRDEQYSQREREFETTLTQHQITASLFSKIEKDDPELFKYLDERYIAEEQEHAKQSAFTNKFQGELKARDEKINSLAQKIDLKDKTEIRTGFEKELSEVQTKNAAQLSKLGVNLNWDKVKEAWAADSTGKMSVEQAMYAVHGPDIQKAYASHNKLLKTKTKTQASLLGRSAVGAGQRGGEETKEYSPGDYSSILSDGAKNL